MLDADSDPVYASVIAGDLVIELGGSIVLRLFCFSKHHVKPFKFDQITSFLFFDCNLQ